MCNSELGDVKDKTLCYPISTPSRAVSIHSLRVSLPVRYNVVEAMAR